MSIVGTETVREIALRMPSAVRIFENVGIDYCCRGNRTLADACASAGVDAAGVAFMLRRLEEEPEPEGLNLATISLAEVIEHVVSTHHEFTTKELTRLRGMLDKVLAVHGREHPWLTVVDDAFSKLEADLPTHMLKEERVLFPYVVELERSAGSFLPAPFAPFGRIENPIRMMETEHETVGAALEELRAATGGYATPGGACPTFVATFRGLEDLERDLHEHIHIENNILFPRALAMRT